VLDRGGIQNIIRLIHTIVNEKLLHHSRGRGGSGAPPIPPVVMKEHPLDPDAGPHTGALTEDDVTFDDATGHDHQGAGDTGKKVTAAKVINVPAGEIAATDVQAAINELDGEKISDVEIQEDDVKVADATIVNFEGGGGKVTDEGGGKVTVDITPGGNGNGNGEHIHAYKEDKSAECDGVKVTFIVAQQFEAYTLRLALNGQEQVDGAANDYIEGAMRDTLTMAVAPVAGDTLVLHYLAQRA